jgi:hypothetical protein
LNVTTSFVTKDFVKKNYYLAAKVLNSSHTAEKIADEIWNVLDQYQIPRNIITQIVTDGAANMIKCRDVLNFESDTCYLHNLNLINKHSLKPGKGNLQMLKNYFTNRFDEVITDMKAIEVLVKKCKVIVTHFKKSHLEHQNLLLKQKEIKPNEEPLHIVGFVKTRFNSTFYMLDRKLKLHDVLNNNFPDFSFDENEVSILTNYKLILGHYETITKLVSASNCVASCIIPFTFTL